MRKLLDRLFQINFRVILITLGLLIALDFGLESFFLPRYLNPNQNSAGTAVNGISVPIIRRLPADDRETMALWKQTYRKDRGYKVVFLGDSVVFGGGVSAENQTIPAYFSRHISLLAPDKKIFVYNFSLPGCTPTDTYHILRNIRDLNPDLVIYDLNLGWFGSARVMEHSRLAGLQATHSAATAAGQHRLNKAEPEEVLTELATANWSLYRNRILLNYLLFNQPLKEKARQILNPQPAAVNMNPVMNASNDLYKPWYEKNMDAVMARSYPLGRVDLSPANPHRTGYNLLLTELSRYNAVLFIVPRNKALYQKYGLLDERVLGEKQALLAGEAQAKRIPVFDYTYQISSHYFTDTVHLNDRGNQIIAEKLAWDISRTGHLREKR